MSQNLTIKKGLDLSLKGAVDNAAAIGDARSETYAIVPADFTGMVPKIEVKEGDPVKAGQPLIHDKADEKIKLVSPVSGTVKAVVRGERRRIERVVIESDAKNESVSLDTLNIMSDQAAARDFLKTSGLWAMMRQRPYDIVPAAESVPRDIFVTGLDTAPLAPDLGKAVEGMDKALAKGVAMLKTLTRGKVYVSRSATSSIADIDGAEMINVKGPHPAGNVGVQIANIAPVNKGETVWTLDIVTLARIGQAAETGIVPMNTLVAVTGSEVTAPCYVNATIGIELGALLKGKIADDKRHHRIISGNVLTGTAETADGYLRFPYRQVTVIPEGDDVDEFMGWASVSPKKMSQSRSFPSRFLPRRLFAPDARLLGGRRALIMSGEYDRYLPMDIMAEYLLKAILGRDIEKMEELGIYEIAPEDLALGEYGDTSKLEAQKIVREGLDYLRKELE